MSVLPPLARKLGKSDQTRHVERANWRPGGSSGANGEVPALNPADRGGGDPALPSAPAVPMRREPQTVCGGHGGCDLELVQRTSAFVERMDRGLVRAGYVGHLPARASYIDRIFKGANPAELPAQAPTKFEFAINLKTATTLGLTVPPTVIALAPGWMKRVRTWCGRHGGRCCVVRASP